MDTRSKNIGFYIKSALIVAAVFFATNSLSSEILTFSQTGDIFALNTELAIRVTVLMLAVMYLFTLSIGAWDKWEQFAIIPIPTALGVTLSLMLLQQLYALYIGLAFLVLMELFILSSTKLKKLLLKFSPTIIMQPILRGTLFLFSLLSVISIILSSNAQNINIGNEIGTMIEEPLKQAVTKQIPTELRSFVLTEVDFKGLAETQINKTIEPYKNYIKPIMAILTFFLFQFFGSIALFIYKLTVNILMWLVLKTKLIKIELVEVPQEILKF
jgi:hypothetical protein